MEIRDAGKDVSETELMSAEFERLNRMCLTMEQQIEELEGKTVHTEKLATFREGFLTMRIAMLYYSEANRCVQAEAWFAASTVGSAALEALLLARCFFDSEKVKIIPKFRNLKTKDTRDFSHFARLLDLGKLLEIADSLSWFQTSEFPALLRGYMTPYFSSEDMEALIKPFQASPDIGQLCAKRLQENRNLIHPSVCLKKGELPSAQVGMVGTFFLLTLLAILISKQ